MRYYLICILGGILFTLSFPPYGHAWIGWCALIPLFYVCTCRDLSIGQIFKSCLLFGLAHRITSLYWIDYVLQAYGQLPLVCSAPLCIALCAYLALYPTVFGLWVRVFYNHQHRHLLLPSAWVVLEWLQTKALTGFPWNLLGYSQGPITWILQSADIWGVYGVSWIIVLANVIGTDVIRRRISLSGCILLVAILGGIFVYGHHCLQAYTDHLKAHSDYKYVKIAIIQGNIDQAHKWDERFRKDTVEKYLTLSRQALLHNKETHLIVWPETAMPFFFGLDAELSHIIQEFAKEVKVAIIFGSPGITMTEEGKEEGFLNKAYLIGTDGQVIDEYSKEHLVPFGEYVPLKNVLFFVKRLVPAAGDFVPGKTSGVITYGNVHYGMLICYEAIFPELSRKRVLNGADILVNISNDAWFGNTSAPHQHLEMARWRAVETRRPMVRATNTGISTIFDSLGNIKSSLGLFVDGYLHRKVYSSSDKITIYVRFGNWFIALCGLTLLIKLVYVVRQEYRRKRRINI